MKTEMNEACIWQYIFLGELGVGGGGGKRCWHNIRRGSYLMMMLNYKGGGDSRIWQKVIT